MGRGTHGLTARTVVMIEPKTISVEVRNDPVFGVRLYLSVEGSDAVYGPLSMAELSAAMEKLARGLTP